jgi:hypothetical protein
MAISPRDSSNIPDIDFAMTYIFLDGQVALPRACLLDAEAAVSPTAAFSIHLNSSMMSAFDPLPDMGSCAAHVAF